jgi:hypothetical protein
MKRIGPDEKITRTILNALEELANERRKWEEKRNAKLWAEIEVPLTLAHALPRFTKDELSTIRQSLNLKNLSSLKKDELIARLQEMIPSTIPETFLQFDRHRYNLVKTMVRNGGHSPAPQLDQRQLNYLMNRGIAFPGTVDGQKVLAMPSETLKIFKEIDDRNYRRRVARNWDVVRLTQGALYYYGTVGYKQIDSMIKNFGIQYGDFSDFIKLIDHAIAYYGVIKWSKCGLSNFQVLNDQEIISEQNARPELDYYPFSREELLQAGEPDFVDRNASYLNLVVFMTENYEINWEMADNLVEACVYAINTGKPATSVISLLESRLEIDSLELLQSLTDLTVDLMNNTRQWTLKGYTSAEVLSAEQPWFERPPEPPAVRKKADVFSLETRKKVGKNDPCPCGSGLKFKKCCGRGYD